MTHQVIISLASNCGQEQNLHQAHLCLEQILSSCQYTEAIWTEPFKAKGADASMYLNQLVYATTSLTVEKLTETLKDIELRLGRTAEDRREGIVRIDLDLMLFGQQRYHLRDWDRPYIKALLPKRVLTEAAEPQGHDRQVIP